MPLTPASPTIPIANPAASPLKPTDSPAPRYKNDLQRCAIIRITEYFKLTKSMTEMIQLNIKETLITITQFNSRTFVSDQHRHDEAVNGDDTRHDHRDHRPHNQFWSHNTHCCYSCTTLRGTIGRPECYRISGS